jgi:hypothetical protein
VGFLFALRLGAFVTMVQTQRAHLHPMQWRQRHHLARMDVVSDFARRDAAAAVYLFTTQFCSFTQNQESQMGNEFTQMNIASGPQAPYIFDTKEEADKMYATIVRLTGSDNNIQCGKLSGKYCIRALPVLGDAFKKLLPPKPSSDYGKSTEVPNKVQSIVDDWLNITNTSCSLDVYTMMQDKEKVSLRVFERALINCPDVTHMLCVPSAQCFIIGMNKAMVCFTPYEQPWNNITPGIMVHLDNGVFFKGETLFRSDVTQWKMNGYEGPLFKGYVGFHDIPEPKKKPDGECQCLKCMMMRGETKKTKKEEPKEKPKEEDRGKPEETKKEDKPVVGDDDEMPGLEDVNEIEAKLKGMVKPMFGGSIEVVRINKSSTTREEFKAMMDELGIPEIKLDDKKETK